MDERLSLVERVELLQSVDFLGGIPGRILAAVADLVEELEVAAGDVLVHRGDDGDAMYVVASGRLGVDVGDARPFELGARSAVGELVALLPDRHAATVTALEPTVLIRLRTPVLQELLLDYPEVCAGVISALVVRCRALGASRWDAALEASR